MGKRGRDACASRGQTRALALVDHGTENVGFKRTWLIPIVMCCRREYGRRIRWGGGGKKTKLCLLSTNTGVGVGDLDAESLSLLEDVDALLGRDVVGDLCGVRAVVHKEKFDVTNVGDDEAAVAVGHQMAGLLVRTVTNLGHADGAAETTADSTVDTLGLAPGLADTVVSVRVVALEGLGALLDDGDGSGGHLDDPG